MKKAIALMVSLGIIGAALPSPQYGHYNADVAAEDLVNNIASYDDYENGMCYIIVGDHAEVGDKFFSPAERNPDLPNLNPVILSEVATENGTYPVTSVSIYLTSIPYETITLPDTITSIHDGCFSNNSSLKSVHLSDALKVIPEWTFYECPSLTNFNFPSELKTIGKNAFTHCLGINSLSIPSGVTTIEEYAFSKCHALASIDLPQTLKKLGDDVFYECYSLKHVTIPESVEDYGKYLFAYSGVESVDLPENLNRIPYCFFYSCNMLRDFDIPDHIKKIEEDAFGNCVNLKEVTIPDSVTDIDNLAFCNCKSLKDLTIPETVKNFGTGVFSGSGIESVQLPKNLTGIPDSTFCDCWALKQYEITDNIKTIGYAAFEKCYSLSSITIPDSVSKIGDSAFRNCISLGSVDLADSVSEIGRDAFSECSAMKSVIIPKSVKSIGVNAFSNCSKLESITFLNPDCVIGDEKLDEPKNSLTICNSTDTSDSSGVFNGTIYGWNNSTAHEFADKYGYKFKSITETPDVIITPETVETTFSSKTATTTTTTAATNKTTTTTTTTAKPGADKDPIIIVPGIMGSRLFNDKDCTDKVWSPNSDKLGIVLAFLTRITNPYPITYPSPEHDLFDLAERININNYLYVRNYDKNGRPINQNKLSKDEREYGAIDHLKITDDDNNNEEEYNNYASLGILDRLCERFPDREIYVFSYDWRRSNDESAQKLRDFVDALDTDKVDIVAHSMGGLVSSRYYAAYGRDKKIDKIITCGTPYEGAPHMFEAVELGMFTGEKANDAAMKYLGDLARNTIAEFDGVFELLPSMNYCDLISMSELKQIPNDEVDGIPDDEEDKSDIQIIESRLRGDSYRNMINKEYGVKAASKAFQFQNSVRGDNGYNVLLGYENAYFFIGQNRKTVRNVCFGRNNDDSVSSVPYYIDRVIYTENGDGTVPYFSASMCDQLRDVDTQHQFYVDSKHMDLMKNIHVISNVCRILDNEVTEYLPPINTDPYSVMRIDCPVDVEIGSGNDRLCSSPDSLSLESSFGRLDILGKDNDIKMLCIDEDTNLDVNLTGTDKGSMDFTVRHFSGEDELLDERIFEDVPLTDKTIIKTKADNNEITVLNVDIDGDGTVDETWTAKKNETVTAPDESVNITTAVSVNVTTTKAASTTTAANSTTTVAASKTTTSEKAASSTTTAKASETASTTTAAASELQPGDINGDKIIDGRDASMILTEYARTSTSHDSEFSNEQRKAADVNNDNVVDGRDATLVLTYYTLTSTGKKTSFAELK